MSPLPSFVYCGTRRQRIINAVSCQTKANAKRDTAKEEVKKILLSLKENPREAYVVYINPVHKEIFMSAGFEQIYHLQKLKYIEASIFMLDVRNEMYEV